MQYAQNAKQMNQLSNRLFAQTSQGKVYTFPEQITLMPLTVCNYKCIMCGEWRKEKKPQLPWETLLKLDSVLPFVQTLFVTGGEPLMYSRIRDVFAMGRKAGCNLWMVTNGALMDEGNRNMIMEEGLSQVKFSLDSATQKTYAKIRGGNLMKVFANIGQLAKLKVTRNSRFPRIKVGFVAMRSNIEELGKFVAIAKEIGVDSIYVTYCQIQSEDMIPESLYLYQDLSDKNMIMASEIARRVGMHLELPPLFNPDHNPDHDKADSFSRVSDHCLEPWRQLFIGADGNCSLCCGGGGSCGNLNETDFMTMWNHPARVKARERVNTDNPPAKCRSCRTVKQNAHNIGSHFPRKNFQRIAQEMASKELVEAV